MYCQNKLLSVAFALCSAPAFAGPVADFETPYDQIYAGYRNALFATNSGNAEKSAAALHGLDKNWGALITAYGPTPPPQYEVDPRWAR